MSQNDIMMTVFPMFQQHIEPHLVHAHVSRRELPKINLITDVNNNFDASCLLCSSSFCNLKKIDSFLDLSCFEQL